VINPGARIIIIISCGAKFAFISCRLNFPGIAGEEGAIKIRISTETKKAV
jgi:hypothetical protein